LRWLVRLGLAWRQIRTTFPSRARLAGRDALATALACALSWVLAVWLWGPHPTFAVVTAVVCLAPSLPSHLAGAPWVARCVIVQASALSVWRSGQS